MDGKDIEGLRVFIVYKRIRARGSVFPGRSRRRVEC